MQKISIENIMTVFNTFVESVELNQNDMDTDIASFGIDSLTFIRLIVMLEEEFGIDFPDEHLIASETNTINKIFGHLVHLEQEA